MLLPLSSTNRRTEQHSPQQLSLPRGDAAINAYPPALCGLPATGSQGSPRICKACGRSETNARVTGTLLFSCRQRFTVHLVPFATGLGGVQVTGLAWERDGGDDWDLVLTGLGWDRTARPPEMAGLLGIFASRDFALLGPIFN